MLQFLPKLQTNNKGIFYCNLCGYVAQGKMVELAKLCDGKPASDYGKNNIRRLREGLLPYHIKAWPVDTAYDMEGNIVSQPERAVAKSFQKKLKQIRKEELAGGPNRQPQPAISEQARLHNEDEASDGSSSSD